MPGNDSGLPATRVKLLSGQVATFYLYHVHLLFLRLKICNRDNQGATCTIATSISNLS